MHFDHVYTCTDPGWWRVDAEGGVHVHDSVRDALRAGICLFTRCQIDEAAMAVFLDEVPPPEVLARLVGQRPDWMDAIIHARVMSDPHEVVARIVAEMIHCKPPRPEACAFAAACVAWNAGTFKVIPERYVVDLGSRVIGVIMTFDWDTEQWSGDAVPEPVAEDRS